MASVSIPNGSVAAGASLQELFAPGQYRTMKDAERISSPSFELMDAGFKLMGTEHAEGPRTKAPITYKTSFIGGSPGVDFPLPNAEMPKLVRRSAGARVGVDSTDLRRFVDRTAPRKITIDQPGWVVALRKSLQRYQAPATSYTTAATTLAKLIAQNEANRSVYSVFPAHEIDANEVP